MVILRMRDVDKICDHVHCSLLQWSLLGLHGLWTVIFYLCIDAWITRYRISVGRACYIRSRPCRCSTLRFMRTSRCLISLRTSTCIQTHQCTKFHFMSTTAAWRRVLSVFPVCVDFSAAILRPEVGCGQHAAGTLLWPQTFCNLLTFQLTELCHVETM